MPLMWEQRTVIVLLSWWVSACTSSSPAADETPTADVVNDVWTVAADASVPADASHDAIEGGNVDASTPDVGSDARAECTGYFSLEEEFSPVQVVMAGLPAGTEKLMWIQPSAWTDQAAFAGVPGEPASHEGLDYVHDETTEPDVAVLAATDGTVIYVRGGCPQSSMFEPNTTLRECGSGWGNHVIVEHPGGIRTRYAHLAPKSVTVVPGQVVDRGERLAWMGNTGRSELRHLHFEIGFGGSGDPCGPAWSFDVVHDPSALETE